LIIYYLFKLSWSAWLNRAWRWNVAMAAAVSFIGALTLEIYLVHMPMVTPFFERIVFPANIVFFWMVTLVAAYPLSVAAKWVQSLVQQQPFGAARPGAATPAAVQ
jgi:membrane-bound acyltransferase YfiQ involved in biofilm formation